MSRPALLLSMLLSLLTLAGCSPHPRADLSLPAVAGAFAGSVTGGTVLERWWEAFADPHLNALMEQAFAGNLDLAQATARLQQARAVAGSAAAGRQPSLNLEGQLRRERGPSLSGDSTSDSYRLSLAAGYEIDLWNKLGSRSKAAALEVGAAAGDRETVCLTLSAQLVDLYYLAAEQAAQLELTTSAVAAAADTLARVESRYRAGLAGPLEVYQSRQNLAATQARRPTYEAGLALTRHALAVLLGQPPAADLLGPAPALPETAVAFPAGLPAQLLQRRPDLRAGLQRLQASDERIGAAVAERFPSFNLAAGLGYSGGSLVLGDFSGLFWNALVGATQPLFDGGRRAAEVERTQALFQENLARYHKAVLTALREAEDALVAGAASEARIALQQQRAAAAAAALRLSRERYLQGLSDYLPVLTAQGLDLDARSQLLAARRQLLADRVSLARALGGSWMAAVLESTPTLTATEGSLQ